MSVPALRQEHLQTYLSRMEAGLDDKIFFMDHLPDDAKIFIDIGCANGVILKAASLIRPDCYFIGYDEDTQSIKMAKEQNIPNSFFSDDFYGSIEKAFEIQEEKGPDFKTVMIFSSVLHEFQSYLKYHEQRLFWEELMDLGIDYLVFRDMGIPLEDTYLPMNATDVYNIHHFSAKNETLKKALDSFMKKWGHPDSYGGFIHWLLKFHYVDNWERELNEDYLVMTDELMENLDEGGYSVIYNETYTHPWIKKRTQEVYHLDLNLNTHFKIIAKRK